MSRSGYTDDDDDNRMGLYRGNVTRSIRGKRGQEFLRELIAALDAMPVKELIEEELISDEGEVCAIGAVCKARGLDVSKVDCEAPEQVCQAVGISECMAREIAYENDEGNWRTDSETSAERWQRMRKWAEEHLVSTD